MDAMQCNAMQNDCYKVGGGMQKCNCIIIELDTLYIFYAVYPLKKFVVCVLNWILLSFCYSIYLCMYDCKYYNNSTFLNLINLAWIEWVAIICTLKLKSIKFQPCFLIRTYEWMNQKVMYLVYPSIQFVNYSSPS